MINKFIRFFVIISMFILSVFVMSCDKESTPTAPADNIPDNLFPLQVGRQWVFDMKETDTLGNVLPNRTGTSVMNVTQKLTLAGRECFELIDSMKIADTVEISKNYFHIDDKGNVWQYLFFESSDPGSGFGWLKTFNKEIGLDKTHLIIDTVVQFGEISFRVKMTSIVKKKVSVSVPYGQFSDAYPAELEMNFSMGIISVSYKFFIWLVPNIGFVKFVEQSAPDFGQPYSKLVIKELKSKNF